MSSELRRIVLETIIIFVLGAVLGLSFNYRMVMNAFTGKTVAPAVKVEVQEGDILFPLPVDLGEVQELLKQGAVIVDARSEELYAEAHIPKAVNLNMAYYEETLPAFLKSVSRDAVVITYCSGYGCDDSFEIGMRLIDEGYMNVHVFEGGLPQWRDAGLPVEGAGGQP